MFEDLDMNEYHKALLGLPEPWEVAQVRLDVEKQTVDIL